MANASVCVCNVYGKELTIINYFSDWTGAHTHQVCMHAHRMHACINRYKLEYKILLEKNWTT